MAIFERPVLTRFKLGIDPLNLEEERNDPVKHFVDVCGRRIVDGPRLIAAAFHLARECIDDTPFLIAIV
jgi:hypothetical protein